MHVHVHTHVLYNSLLAINAEGVSWHMVSALQTRLLMMDACLLIRSYHAYSFALLPVLVILLCACVLWSVRAWRLLQVGRRRTMQRRPARAVHARCHSKQRSACAIILVMF